VSLGIEMKEKELRVRDREMGGGGWEGGGRTHEHTECQAFSLVVRIGSPHPLTRKRVLLPLFGSKGGDTLACWGGGGGPNSHEGTDTVL
jgi:hypothetical protein